MVSIRGADARETRHVVFGNVAAEVVEKQERIEIRGVAKAEGCAEVPRPRLPAPVWIGQFA